MANNHRDIMPFPKCPVDGENDKGRKMTKKKLKVRREKSLEIQREVNK
jgi:hypothetical protein